MIGVQHLICARLAVPVRYFAKLLVVTASISLFAQLSPQANEPVSSVAEPQFSVSRGFFEAPFTLSITSATAGAVIFYSLDCSEPQPGQAPPYTRPISITNSTVVRARAFKAGFSPSSVQTHTFIFLSDALHQSPDGKAPRYFPESWGANKVDYGMDPEVISRYSAAEWHEALTQIPSVSLVCEMKHLFDPAAGIYANALQHGQAWERPASLELLDPAKNPQERFQENCGVRIRGGYSRNPQYAKHAFRIFFRRDYGVPKLGYPLFDDGGADEFDTFDLRTSQNYSWGIDAVDGRFDTMVQDAFCRETLGAMGQPATRSRSCHLYLNGQYWGLYEIQERPEKAYGSTYFGGRKEDYDVVKSANHIGAFVTEAADGNLDAFRSLWEKARAVAANPANSNYYAVLGRNADGTRNPSLAVLLEVDNLIDYMLAIFYTGDGDAPLSYFLNYERSNNWFGLRNRKNPERGFHFFNHDAEHTLGAPFSQVDRTGPYLSPNQNNFTYANPQWIHQDLAANAEYRQRFADHAQRHLFGGGALTADAATNRILRKAAQIDKAIRAYSARWGDTVREPPYGESDWRETIDRMTSAWFPARTSVVLDQLRKAGLYPELSAPVIRFELDTNRLAAMRTPPGITTQREEPSRPQANSVPRLGGDQSGFTPSDSPGNTAPGYVLLLTHDNEFGAAYFTTDGTDPRLVGGATSASAQRYARPVSISAATRVLARVLRGTNWSALVEAQLPPPQSPPTIPRFSIRRVDNTVALRFAMASSATNGYTVEYIENISNPSWGALTNLASGPIARVVEIFDTINAASRFYRVRQLP
ncbi:MAG: chitobiase/beta-hexosaminidase C-terminal domain-containing protein [Verrucomicrobia bacterium]|nr:chitobiase/beta-hexosaminidase C-terminal domain-containing protein [Verrucomicrobiota bacterium]